MLGYIREMGIRLMGLLKEIFSTAITDGDGVMDVLIDEASHTDYAAQMTQEVICYCRQREIKALVQSGSTPRRSRVRRVSPAARRGSDVGRRRAPRNSRSMSHDHNRDDDNGFSFASACWGSLLINHANKFPTASSSSTAMCR